MKRVLAILLLSLVTLNACASARQTAIIVDESFATAVFALDDAEFQACQAHFLTDAQCASLNGPIKKALVDVKAVTLAVKAMPKDGTIPTSLPDLLKDLNDAQAIITALRPAVPVDLGTKASAANAAAIALLTQLVGGGR